MKIGIQDLLNKKMEIYADSSHENSFQIFWKWLAENEKYFDAEAGEYLESLLRKMSVGAMANIVQMPESKEKRSLIRQAASIGDTHYKAKNLLEGIQRPPPSMDQVANAWSQDITKTHQAILDLLFDVVHSTSQEKQPIVFVALFYSCIDELTAAQHLAGHHYYVQASNHLRTVLETIDRLDLFKKFPEMVDVWAGNDKKRIRNELKPSAVRIKLGRKNFDPLYGYLSELGTHPTFDMFKARAYVDESDSTKARVYVSGTPFEHLRLFYYPISLLVASSLLGSVMRVFEGLHNNEECIEISRENISNMKNFVSNFFIPAFTDQDEKAKEFISVFDKFLASLNDPTLMVEEQDKQ